MIFAISVLTVISANPAIDALAFGCLSCLRHFGEMHRIEKHRFGKT